MSKIKLKSLGLKPLIIYAFMLRPLGAEFLTRYEVKNISGKYSVKGKRQGLRKQLGISDKNRLVEFTTDGFQVIDGKEFIKSVLANLNKNVNNDYETPFNRTLIKQYHAST
jgi:hypothetical protein